MELATARTTAAGWAAGGELQRAFARRRESLRQTWVPRGGARRRGVLDRAIDAEEVETKDFLRLDHDLLLHRRLHLWDADFYVSTMAGTRDLLSLVAAVLFSVDCEWKTQARNICWLTFDWSCSWVCKAADRMDVVHCTCGEGEVAIWNVAL
ncbi:unnamed protein product [Spirodela intermedia]|uniref:Uncharacterized protein n=1 Tax=Spirodela intermedia TaxID=51605 RepID=A0A7I8JCD1_SPIIN|nr:unnamed protein product [Spirodela intermedia]CAA6667780.1 unnamed protein product [Spirodela intermedia]